MLLPLTLCLNSIFRRYTSSITLLKSDDSTKMFSFRIMDRAWIRKLAHFRECIHLMHLWQILRLYEYIYARFCLRFSQTIIFHKLSVCWRIILLNALLILTCLSESRNNMIPQLIIFKIQINIMKEYLSRCLQTNAIPYGVIEWLLA